MVLCMHEKSQVNTQISYAHCCVLFISLESSAAFTSASECRTHKKKYSHLSLEDLPLTFIWPYLHFQGKTSTLLPSHDGLRSTFTTLISCSSNINPEKLNNGETIFQSRHTDHRLCHVMANLRTQDCAHYLIKTQYCPLSVYTRSKNQQCLQLTRTLQHAYKPWPK